VCRDIKLLICAFITYVKPLVEYNTVVWSPSALRNIDALESVQRRFTKQLSGLKHMPYAERLKYLNLPSLELRRVRADMYWCYKIVFGLVDIQPDDFFLLIPVTVTRGHKYKLFKRGSKACVLE